jgi:predicted AAA+ superfamily ATPase
LQRQGFDHAGEGIDFSTLGSYSNAFEKLLIIENVEAWTPKSRSASTIRTKSKKQFVDPSIAIVAMGASAKGLLEDMETFGFFFESMVTRDLRVYAENIDGDLYHYRDNTGLEVDCIIKLNDGRWAAVEVKVGGNKIDDEAKNLTKLATKIDIDAMRNPSFLMAVYAGQHAYPKNDGVYVVPIGCLKQ